jgi:hypothetical protein
MVTDLYSSYYSENRECWMEDMKDSLDKSETDQNDMSFDVNKWYK